VRCSFQCRSCGFAAPLDSLDIDGAVECAYCGLRQRFEPRTWSDALDFAQAVGDLSGPEPEGRYADPGVWIAPDNPFRDVGETLTFSEHRESGVEISDGMTVPKSLQIQVAPGFPVCLRCRVGLAVQVMPGGRATTTCPSCSETATFALPEGARAFGATVVAVVAHEHRVNRVNATEMAPDAVHRLDPAERARLVENGDLDVGEFLAFAPLEDELVSGLEDEEIVPSPGAPPARCQVERVDEGSFSLPGGGAGTGVPHGESRDEYRRRSRGLENPEFHE